MRHHRRHFLKRALSASTLVSMGASTVPTFLARSAGAAIENGSSSGGDRILVVVQLLGGNDGLNTVVPHGIDGYNRGRRALRLPPVQLHTITKEIGFHPGMGQLAGLLEQNRLAIIQGVGYPNPDRSHFRSMEIWETARTENTPEATATGWLGRVLDSAPVRRGIDLPALQVGSRPNLALRARLQEAPSIESLDQYRLQVAGGEASAQATRDSIQEVARFDRPAEDPLLGFLRRSTLSAYDSSQRLEQVAQQPSDGDYPSYGLANRLKLIAQIIKADFKTRIYYTMLDGFDTHANQLAAHAGLLTELSDSLAAFHQDLTQAGQADRVAVLCFSEFGRRVAENASAGTDHGAAAPVFVLGPVREAGLVGEHPSFDDLDDGDLKFHTDFRRVYAGLLQPWLGIPAAPILGDAYEPLPLFSDQS